VLLQRNTNILLLNPMSSIIEGFRYTLLGNNSFVLTSLVYTTCFAVVALILGAVVFNKVEKDFVDTV